MQSQHLQQTYQVVNSLELTVLYFQTVKSRGMPMIHQICVQTRFVSDQIVWVVLNTSSLCSSRLRFVESRP